MRRRARATAGWITSMVLVACGADRVVERDRALVCERPVTVTGRALPASTLAAGRGFVRGAPLSNAFLKPGQNPRVLTGAFNPILMRYADDGSPIEYRALFRTNRHIEFRQTLLERDLRDAEGQRVLEYHIKIDGARSQNGRDYWLTFEPSGLGVEGFSVTVDGAFDPATGRLTMQVVERLGEDDVPRRYDYAFVAFGATGTEFAPE